MMASFTSCISFFFLHTTTPSLRVRRPTEGHRFSQVVQPRRMDAMLYCAAYLHVWMYVDSVIPESTDFSTLRWISERPRKWLARHSSTSSPDSGCSRWRI